MELEHFYFPVEEREVALTGNGQPVSGYKAIVSPGNGQDELISVAKDTYKLVPNRQVIEPFLQQVHALQTRWYIDPSHTFAEKNRMRLQITFPDLAMHDGESLIPLSMYLHNSYDMSEGVRVFFGAIRLACSNGMVLGNILGSFYGRHTKGFAFDRLAVAFDDAAERIEAVQSHVRYLQESTLSRDRYQCLEHSLGKKRIAEVLDPQQSLAASQWEAYNRLTYHISHDVDKPRRAELQRKLSGVFEL
ncbi:DUF932 domain-containing protein [Natronogracilivirga saccharolytica]|uniref:DUF932 domain-containing protein n=1 Tax=Natronogracilivirga saccharolytica TaxID=2812953 RepID=A0A8J7UUR6_9BACT|nr:DUF932 domain-containing protein [Natronogracilivirga saccharolytica]MBP3193896.1 DUF932 domain-containing protein [Natronogracilivirga saccharolytica]